MAKNAVVQATILICGLILYPTPARAADPCDPATARQEPHRTVLNEDQQVELWSLACSALLIELNHQYHDSLSPVPINDITTAKMKRMLRKSYGIRTTLDVTTTLAGIATQGGRASFELYGRSVCALTEDEYQQVLERLKEKPVEHERFRIARQHYEELGKKGIIAWDFVRYISVCRWSYAAGYITEEQAWDAIIAAAQVLQHTFDSWQDMGRNYITGRRFITPIDHKKYGYRHADALQRLIDMPSSPWNKLPWDLDIGTPDESAAEVAAATHTATATRKQEDES